MPFRPQVRLTKRLGQHLLVDPTYLRKVAESADLSSVDLVLEIGPGTGNLTEFLVRSARKVLAVELDRRLYPALKSRFADHFQLFEGDILDRGRFNPAVADLLPENWALVANLPYNVASPVMIEALFLPNSPKFLCVTIQKEVARRLAAEPGGKTYGALSVLVQALADVKIVAYVPPGAFLPPPKVESAVVKMTWNPQRAGTIKDLGFFRDLVSRLFQHRRKTVRSGWLKMLPQDRQPQATRALANLHIDPIRRPETLTIDEFIALANGLL
jgi:16S rRNA (adenine1518-N6/adenine1519-N6)-dimethyltransferase